MSQQLDQLAQAIYKRADRHSEVLIEESLRQAFALVHNLGNGTLEFELPESAQSAQRATVIATPAELLEIVKQYCLRAHQAGNRDRFVADFIHKAENLARHEQIEMPSTLGEGAEE